jgi:uncharacterized membrane protein YebE (DUF533 family)
MSTFRTLALAAMAAMTIGAGSAMAQTLTTQGSVATGMPAGYWTWPNYQSAAPRATLPAGAPQAGSSDVTTSPWAGTGAFTDSSYYGGANG